MSFEGVGQWLGEARKQGAVGVVMRVRDDDDVELKQLPTDASKRYEQGGIVILIYDQKAS